jgi:hypothetical protein
MVYTAAYVDHTPEKLERLGRSLGVSFGALETKLHNRVYVTEVPVDELVGPDCTGDAIDVLAAQPEHFQGWPLVDNDGPVNAVVVSFIADLGAGVEVSTSARAPETHWMQVLFPIYPALGCKAGDVIDFQLWPRLINEHKSYTWEARLGDQFREGDALQASIGDADDMLWSMGLQRTKRGEIGDSRRVQRWLAMVDGKLGDSADAMADKLYAAMPGEFTDVGEARQEVLRFLNAAKALR